MVVSDSPTDQYRNAKNVFLIKRLATELGICISLLFTESSHGNSPCNRVGGNIENKQVDEVLLRNYGENNLKQIHSARDVKEIIETKTNLTYDISIHTAEVIKEFRDSLPKLSSLTGAMNILEILINPNRVVQKKNLPSDVFYQNVNIKESRRSEGLTLKW